jgi:hypothetical protein
VDLSTHQLFNVKPTTFLAFARRNAEALGAAVANGFEVGAMVTLFHGPKRPRFRQSRDTGASK